MSLHWNFCCQLDYQHFMYIFRIWVDLSIITCVLWSASSPIYSKKCWSSKQWTQLSADDRGSRPPLMRMAFAIIDLHVYTGD